MNRYIVSSSILVACTIALLLSGAGFVVAADADRSLVTVDPQISRTFSGQYESFLEKLQKEWRVDPLIAERHHLSSTGWENPACGPGITTQQRPATAGGGLDPKAKCLEACVQRMSLDNPNGVLLCRSGCM